MKRCYVVYRDHKRLDGKTERIWYFNHTDKEYNEGDTYISYGQRYVVKGKYADILAANGGKQPSYLWSGRELFDRNGKKVFC